MNTRNQQGFSLIEILVSVTIIGGAFFVLAQSQLTSLQSTAQSRDTSTTKSRLQAALETEQTVALQATQDPLTGKWVYNFDLYKTACAITPCTYTRTETPNITYTVRSLQNGAVLAISATSPLTRSRGPLSLSTFVSCYDVYPSPSLSVPDPCPPVTGGTL